MPNEALVYRGDTFDSIWVNRPGGTESLDIEIIEIQVGDLEPVVKRQPVFPFEILMPSEETKKLTVGKTNFISGKIYYYRDFEGERILVGKTLKGTLPFKTERQLVRDIESND